MVTLQPNLNNLNSKGGNPKQDFISNTVRIGRFIFKKDEYKQILFDIVKSFYQKNDNYLNFLTSGQKIEYVGSGFFSVNDRYRAYKDKNILF
jgi:hypothetical protein